MRLNYKVLGHGPDLVILHGLFGMSDNFLTVAKVLSQQFRVFLVDQRNHGLSEHSDVFNFEVLSQDIADFLDHHSIVQTNLLGHSMGGKTAMQFAFDFERRLNKIIIADMSPAEKPLSDHHKRVLNSMMQLDLHSFKNRTEIEQFLESILHSARLRQLILKNLKRREDNTFAWKLHIDAISRNMHEISKTITNRGRKSPIPALFLKGEHSDYIPDIEVPLIYSMFKHVSIVEIPNASHWIHADNPIAFVEEVKRFLLQD